MKFLNKFLWISFASLLHIQPLYANDVFSLESDIENEVLKIYSVDLTTKEKKLPSNIEAEQALIGSILVNNDIIDEISSIVSANKFFDPAHRKIFEVIENLNNKGMIANPITLKNYFENNSGLEEVGGIDYLVKLTRFSSSVKQSIDYAKIIHEMYVKRELISISENIDEESRNKELEKTGEGIIEDAEKSLFDLAERGNFSQSFLKFNQAVDQTIEMATKAMQSDRGVVGVPTGLTDLDEKLGGLHTSDLVIIAGRPSMGKTALATNIAYYAAKKLKDDNCKCSDNWDRELIYNYSMLMAIIYVLLSTINMLAVVAFANLDFYKFCNKLLKTKPKN